MTAWNHTVTLHNFQTHFNSRLRSWLVLNCLFHSGVKWTSNINNQALLFYFIQYRLVVFNLVVSLYKFLKSHSSLLLVDSYTGCGSWLLSYWIHTWTLVVAHVIHVFVIPVITQHSTYKIGPTESSAPILSSLQHQHCFWASFLHFNTIWLTASSVSLKFYTLQAHFACQLSL